MEFLVLNLALYVAMGLFWLIVAMFSFPEIMLWIVMCFNGVNANPHDTQFDQYWLDQIMKNVAYVLYQFNSSNEWIKLAVYVFPILIYLALCHYIHIGIFYPFQLFGVIVSGFALWWFWGEIVSDSIWHVLLVILSTMIAAGMRIKLHQTINRIVPNRAERDRRFVQQNTSEKYNDTKSDEKETQNMDELVKKINTLSEKMAKSSHE